MGTEFDLTKYEPSDAEQQAKLELAEYENRLKEIRAKGGNIKEYVKIKVLEKLGGINYLAGLIIRNETELKEQIINMFMGTEKEKGAEKVKEEARGGLTINVGALIKEVTRETLGVTEIEAEESKEEQNG